MVPKHPKVAEQIQALLKLKNPTKNDIIKIANSAEFKAFTDDMFSTVSAAPAAPKVDETFFISQILQYTIGTLNLYADAIPHHTIQAIHIHFDSRANSQQIQPQIDIRFDTEIYHIDLSELWKSEIALDPTKRKDMEIMAESSWHEYLESGFYDNPSVLITEMQKALYEQFPNTQINCVVK